MSKALSYADAVRVLDGGAPNKAAAGDDFAVRLQSALAEAHRRPRPAGVEGGTVVFGTTTASGQGGIAIGSVARDVTLAPDLDSGDGVSPATWRPYFVTGTNWAAGSVALVRGV
ncbi:hypothetical protein [Amycolatopsis vastitatis]|uniref:hypothetical protein n=1 Tax=Amycolatopsis vastitatis TaxID=1905142 RepID=UPI001177408B|nr:hypothetical protein [Amycolatopsis vastitatis]